MYTGNGRKQEVHHDRYTSFSLEKIMVFPQFLYWNQIQKAIRTFGDVFVPVIPALVATGLFLGLESMTEKEMMQRNKE